MSSLGCPKRHALALQVLVHNRVVVSGILHLGEALVEGRQKVGVLALHDSEAIGRGIVVLLLRHDLEAIALGDAVGHDRVVLEAGNRVAGQDILVHD